MSLEDELNALGSLSLDPDEHELQDRKKKLDLLRKMVSRAEARVKVELNYLQSVCPHKKRIERGFLHESWQACEMCGKNLG